MPNPPNPIPLPTPVPTTVSVLALALGGKFIGQHVGFARIDIYRAGDLKTPIRSGLADQGLVPGTDGSGVVAFVMGQPYPWGYPVRADQATTFTVDLPMIQPEVLTFVATSMQDPRISTSVSRLVIPGRSLTGATAVTVVLQGLLAGLTEPAAGATYAKGSRVTITAQVRMMCGCLIENLYWPVENFSVQAYITGKSVDLVTLNYSGKPSFFSTEYTFPNPGDYQITLVATEMNGNAGSAAPVTITVK